MQWIPDYSATFSTVNQTVTNITESPMHAYAHTVARTQTAQTIEEAPFRRSSFSGAMSNYPN